MIGLLSMYRITSLGLSNNVLTNKQILEHVTVGQNGDFADIRGHLKGTNVTGAVGSSF